MANAAVLMGGTDSTVSRGGNRRRAALGRCAAVVALAAVVLGGPHLAQAAPAEPDFAALLASPLRLDDDHKTDERRHPVELLRFAQVQPGMKVLDVSAGAGYTTQLLALAVGPEGTVWAQNAKPKPKLEQRLAAHPQANIQVLLRPFDDPYPDEAPRLDLITFILNYHDVANEPVDRARMDRRLFAALKPGGHLVLVDHSAQAGSGARDTKRLHRIDEALVLSELTAAGFVLDARSSFLANPADPRDQAFFDRKEPTDQFALRLLRPLSSTATEKP